MKHKEETSRLNVLGNLAFSNKAAYLSPNHTTSEKRRVPKTPKPPLGNALV